MGKQIPLVIYKDGKRTVIGMASIEKDGAITAQVEKDHWEVVKGLAVPGNAEFSIAPDMSKRYRSQPTPESIESARTIVGRALAGDGVTEIQKS